MYQSYAEKDDNSGEVGISREDLEKIYEQEDEWNLERDVATLKLHIRN